jgi:hypothetical protein
MSSNELGVVVTALLVVIGVVLEGWEHLHDYRTGGWKPLTPKIGFGLLVLGLCGELFFEARVTNDAAKMQLQAARIREAVAWRMLTANQAEQIRKELIEFAGEKINVRTFLGNLESSFFADQIATALGPKHGAGWEVHFSQIIMAPPRLASGLTVDIANTASQRDRAAAKSLADVLRSITVHTLGPISGNDRADMILNGDTRTATPIVLTIGVHPPPPMELQIAQ